jgi:hypothetical protein
MSASSRGKGGGSLGNLRNWFCGRVTRLFTRLGWPQMIGDPKRLPLLAPLNHMGRSHPPRLAGDRVTDVSINAKPLQQPLASDPTISQVSTKMLWEIHWCRGSFVSFDPGAREDARLVRQDTSSKRPLCAAKAGINRIVRALGRRHLRPDGDDRRN